MVTESPRGLDLDALSAYLEEHHRDLVGGELSAQLLRGGRSNLTYLVSDETGHEVVLRRPPLGHVLATAHDMSREARVMAALAGSGVPVPDVLVTCPDPEVIGAPFYIMSRARGTAYRTKEELNLLGAERTSAIAATMMRILARLHSIDPESVGLGDFGHSDGFLARQVERWHTQFEGSHSRDIDGMEELYARLRDSVPEQGAPGIVHGDYRLDNLLVDSTDEVTAVLDWEMSTIGDPLTDLALLTVYNDMSRMPVFGRVVTSVALADGFPSNDEIVTTYAATSERDLTRLPWYVGLACFKLAGVMEGIHYRHLHGQTVGAGFDLAGAGVPGLIANGLAALR